jgi:cell division GTPase FtsZ|tara:strand:- start:1993 stop:3423 length:1431 start_codon:yes stop_codon:yes gene_type:complete
MAVRQVPFGEYGAKIFPIPDKIEGKTMSTSENPIEDKMEESLNQAAGGLPATPAPPEDVQVPVPALAPAPVNAPAPPAPASVAPGIPSQPSGMAAVNVGDIAAALDPSAHTPAAQHVEVNDAFDYDVAFNMAFLGSGQGGARLATSFHGLGYRRVALFNTAESDFQGLPEEIERHTLELGGAAKDARFAEQALVGHEEEIWDLLQRSWGNDVDYGLICVGLGGGTGSGTSGKLVEIARQYMESKGKPPRVGVIASIPAYTEGQQVCRNAVTAFQRLLELKVSPLILIDNARIHQLYRPGMTQLYNVANQTVSQLFHLFNQLAAVHSPLITFDRSELAQLLDHGICVMGAASLQNITSPADISAAIRDQLTNNVLAEVDLKKGTKGACLFVGDQNHLDTLSLDYFDAGFTQMNRTLKGGTSVVHRGVYIGTSPGLQAYAMISDLQPPVATLAKLAKEANISKAQLTGGLAEFLGVND